MTDEVTSTDPATPQDSTIADLKAEFAKQFEEFRQQVKTDMDEKDKIIADQQKQIASLTSEVVRNATVAPKPEEHVKTKEELYQEDLDRSVEYCKKLIQSNTYG